MPLDKVEKVVDKVASPERITRWIVRIVLLVVLVSVGITVVKIALHMNTKVNQVTTDRDWFVTQREAIDAAEMEERVAREAYVRHRDEVEARSGLLSISRKEDRVEHNRLTEAILALQMGRIDLIEDYNARAGHVTDENILTGLPKHIKYENILNPAFED
jgi:hypothetical protein